MIPGFIHDPALVEAIGARFDLREPVQLAFDAVVQALANGYDPAVPMVLDLATGVGKTYAMAAMVEYLRVQGVRDVLIVTPSAIVQSKTVANFSPGHSKYIEGSLVAPSVVTPADYDTWTDRSGRDRLFGGGEDAVQLFILNVHQLTPPKITDGETTGKGKEAVKRAFRTVRESSGNPRDYLNSLEDLVIIADEHHLYGDTAKAFQAGIKDLKPAAIIGLTGSASEDDHVLFQYSLKQAITERYVKRPVIAFRKGGYGEHSEEQQLRDALTLLQVKADHYKSYQQVNPEQPKVNAALFVQCADVAHATQISHLLRGAEYFNSTEAVLQVDNEHNDEATLDRLGTMDQPQSPVRAVVSVNKLKEGWDVKNVAVMVTLRAMASEVLTQQTLGRGLRLPFGKWTGDGHIDQLDIVAHESFRSLLRAEDVLKTFGMDSLLKSPVSSATPETTGASAEPDAGHAGTNGAAGTPPPLHTTVPPTAHGASEIISVADGTVGVIVLDDDAQLESAPTPTPVEVKINEAFEGTTFSFPSTAMSRETAPFSLSAIPDTAVEEAALKVTDQGGVLLREAIVIKGKLLSTLAQEDVKVSGLFVSTKEVVASLVQTLVGMKVIEPSGVNLLQIKNRIAPLMVSSADIENWSTKALASAAYHLREVVQRAATAHSRNLGTVTTVRARTIPIETKYQLPLGKEVLELLSTDTKGEGFKRFEHYGPWDKGLFEAAAFDSFSAEYRIAALLNRSGGIEWWMRLYSRHKATIAYTTSNDYNPDFVAQDKNGYHWIIEGKSESGKDDQTVQNKRAAAEETIRLLLGHPDFGGQKWGYVIAYESDVASAESWEDLRAATNPVMTKDYGI
ncbi:DEAD/DEAH box helicase [[Micrococcus luteus] ATCC 49442]|uniref:DEAD/DEAH box helicase n=1 Tax=[Micrococcus luteus] ATCC 49442 TaxID=2698727 RepID=UPI0013D93090|nr:DEAD/DEAH box helicase family protein [[Micrococcus luteus] ATCC 49442]